MQATVTLFVGCIEYSGAGEATPTPRNIVHELGSRRNFQLSFQRAHNRMAYVSHL